MPETLKIDGKMNVHIFCPTHTVYDGVADKVLLPTRDGYTMILKNRAPLFTATKAGIMWIYNAELPPLAYYIDDGIAEIRRNICSVIAWAVPADTIDVNAVKQDRMRQEEKLSNAKLTYQKEPLEKKIAFLKMLENKPTTLTPPKFD